VDGQGRKGSLKLNFGMIQALRHGGIQAQHGFGSLR
jgi:hypothetical protein